MKFDFYSGKRVWALVCALLLGAVKGHGASNLSQEAEAFLGRARERSDIRAPGTESFVLRGQLRLVYVPNGPVEGRYEEVRDSRGHWRRAISMPDLKFNVIEVGDGRRVHRSGSNSYQPYFEYRLRQLLSFHGGPRIPKSEDVTQIKNRKIQRRRVTCVSSKKKGTKREVCVDSETNLPAFERERSGEGDWRFEYLNYTPLGGKSYPRLLRQLEHNKVFVEFEVTELITGPEPDPALFVPPAGAVSWPECDKPFPPEGLETPRPRSPRSLRFWIGQRSVITYIVVGTDGRAHQVTPVHSDTLSLTKATLDAITFRWRFRPAACQGEPVPASLLVETDFFMF